MSKGKKVTIYGAGMSGLVAAINLAREGYEVTVHDKEKTYGGDSEYNPSTHTTPIAPRKVSDYIGIDITGVFHPLLICPIYFHDSYIYLSASGTYSVERGTRTTSLDSLLYPMACDLGVRFEFDSPLKPADIKGLEPGTIIACGLTTQAYDMLDVPYRNVYGWVSRGEIGFDCRSWVWFDECITEYGYLSSVNNYYFNLLFSLNPVTKQALTRYMDFMKRCEGVEHQDWYYINGAVPVANTANPQLIRKGHIFCGTISGYMDPFGWFGITGALMSGKIAAMAVTDPAKAQVEFARFSKYYNTALYFKNYVWYPLLRPRVGLLEKAVNLIGPDRVTDVIAHYVNEGRHTPFAIPGYAHLGACY